MNLQFEVNKQRVVNHSTTELVVADSRNYLYAQFRFSDEWSGVEKTAVFTRGSTTKYVLLDSTDRCLIPWEVVEPPLFTVSVFGGELITANVATVRVTASGLVEGGPPEPATPDIYTQLLHKVTRKADGLAYDDGMLQLMSEGRPMGNAIELSEDGGGGRAVYVGVFTVDDWQDRGIRWELLIPGETHYLGYSVAVLELVRETENGLESVLCHTRQLMDGTVCVEADMAFAGRIVLEGV